MSTLDTVKKVVVDQLSVDEKLVTPEARFTDDLGADSLDTVELVMALEEEFKCEIPDEDAEKIKEAMRTLLENDASSARPEGSMEVCALYWWEQEGKTPKYSSAKVQRSLQVTLKEGVIKPKRFEDYDVQVAPLDGVTLQILS